MTPHEVIRKILDAATVTGRLEDAVDILEEYAEFKSSGFLTWYYSKMTGFMEYLIDIRSIVKSDEIEKKIEEFEGKPLSDLYNLFKEQSIKQQP